MGASARHYKALMKKNCINWQRTPCGSICEIFCPIVLMLILVYARSQIDPVENEDFSLYSLRRPLYPIAKPEVLSSSGLKDLNITETLTDTLNEKDNVDVASTIDELFTVEEIVDPDQPVGTKRFAVSFADQWRALSDYRDFFGYMDYHNVDFTIPINV